ncbi:MAG: hypothetical protein QG650_6, partial [Patescibacteria group bacterium]|nr:hypothetical protein [Patescibacteria group bacterium]
EHSALALLIFSVIFRWIVFLDVILSWSVLFGFRVKIPFVRALLDPCYDSVRRHLPVSFSGLDFAPIILILATLVAEAAIITFVPSVTVLL